jgi:oligoribonuclease (3'-5' exoribonuclease)
MLVPFIDIESTGLNEHKDWLLEVGVVVVDMPSGEEIATFETGIYYPTDMLDAQRVQCDSYVQGMHDRSGLWTALKQRENTIDRKELDGWLQKIAELWLPDPPLPSLSNFNAPFDWRWLHVYAPEFVSKCLHYRVFDLSTFRASVEMVYPKGFGPSAGKGLHRAVEDAREAVTYWKWYRQHVMTPYGRDAQGPGA